MALYLSHFKMFFFGNYFKNAEFHGNFFSFLDKPSESDFPPFRDFVGICPDYSPRGKSGIKEENKVRLLSLYKISHNFFMLILHFTFLLQILLLSYAFFSFFVTFLLTFLLFSFFITSLFCSDNFSFPLYSISSSIIQHYEFNVICQFRLGI